MYSNIYEPYPAAYQNDLYSYGANAYGSCTTPTTYSPQDARRGYGYNYTSGHCKTEESTENTHRMNYKNHCDTSGYHVCINTLVGFADSPSYAPSPVYAKTKKPKFGDAETYDTSSYKPRAAPMEVGFGSGKLIVDKGKAIDVMDFEQFPTVGQDKMKGKEEEDVDRVPAKIAKAREKKNKRKVHLNKKRPVLPCMAFIFPAKEGGEASAGLETKEAQNASRTFAAASEKKEETGKMMEIELKVEEISGGYQVASTTANTMDKGKGKMEGDDAVELIAIMGAGESKASKTRKADRKYNKRARDAADAIAYARFQALNNIQKKREETTFECQQNDLDDPFYGDVEFEYDSFGKIHIKGSEIVKDKKLVDPTNAYAKFDASTIAPEKMFPFPAASKKVKNAGNSMQYHSERTSASQQFRRMHEIGRYNMVAQSPQFPKTQQDLAIHVKEYGADVLEADAKSLKATIERKQAESAGKIPKVGLAFSGKTFVNPGSAVLGVRTMWVPAKDDAREQGSAALEGEDIPEEILKQKDIERRQTLVVWAELSERKAYGELLAEQGLPRMIPPPRYAEIILGDHAMWLLDQGCDKAYVLSLTQAGPVPRRDIPWEFKALVKASGLDEVEVARHDADRIRQAVGCHPLARGLSDPDLDALVGECESCTGGHCAKGYKHVWEFEVDEQYAVAISDMATDHYFRQDTREIDEELLRTKGGWDDLLNEMDVTEPEVEVQIYRGMDEEDDRIPAWVGDMKGWWVQTECVAIQ
jgi:hypothetical protein